MRSIKSFFIFLSVPVSMFVMACQPVSTSVPPNPSSPAPPYVANPVNLSAAWANEGEDKVAQEETRSSHGQSVTNGAWSGSQITLFGAKNEVVAFNLVLEAAARRASSVSVSFDQLLGPGGASISSVPTSGDGVFDWTQRPIELFFVRYLQINGLSRIAYGTYDERHIPQRLERPWSGNGAGSGTWSDRPDHNRHYPDIAVPLEAVPSFSIAAGQSQSIWADIYIPSNATPGLYAGSVTVKEGTGVSFVIPIQLKVRNFALPDVPTSQTMIDLGYEDISSRYVGTNSPSTQSQIDLLNQVRDRHFLMAHRHKLSLIDENTGSPDQPDSTWNARLDGSLFSSANGYAGPGAGASNSVFSVGTFGKAGWQSQSESVVWNNIDAWQSWFESNDPSVTRFLYLADESSNYSQIQSWASEMKADSGPGRTLASMATLDLPSAVNNVPSLDIPTSTMDVGDTSTWDSALNTLRSQPGKSFFMYNGHRPASGTFAIDDDGVALREIPWGQYKKGIDRWFYWSSTYYTDFQGGRGALDLFNNAQTFGSAPVNDSVFGETSSTYGNGDGVLFYPGTDLVYPADSYGLKGPIASLRLKYWRRGVQDVDYLALASAINPSATRSILNSVVSTALWETGVADRTDPTWQLCPIGWSTDPDVWETARAHLANIIETGSP